MEQYQAAPGGEVRAWTEATEVSPVLEPAEIRRERRGFDRRNNGYAALVSNFAAVSRSIRLSALQM